MPLRAVTDMLRIYIRTLFAHAGAGLYGSLLRATSKLYKGDLKGVQLPSQVHNSLEYVYLEHKTLFFFKLL